MPLNIVLVEPLIPQNTGTIARMTAATHMRLHLIEPLGFELSDRYLKRAGLDYWPEVNLTVHPTWEKFLEAESPTEDTMWFLTTKATASYAAVTFRSDDYLIFGNEDFGLRPSFHEEYRGRMLRIPMENPKVRSLNLSNCVSIVGFEARRQLGLLAD